MLKPIFRVFVEFKAAFTPVSFWLYSSYDYAHCFEYIAEHTQTKKRRLYVKQLGNRYKMYQYDETFAAELLANEQVEADEFYEEDTIDDKTIVQVHKRSYKPVVWRGLQHGRSPIVRDSVLDEDGGLGD